MVELAEIFRLHGPDYRAQFGDRMLPSHRRAMQDIETGRTANLGGQLYYCTQCQEQRYSLTVPPLASIHRPTLILNTFF